MPSCIYPGVNRIQNSDTKYLNDYNTNYTCNPFICTILLVLPELSKKILLKDYPGDNRIQSHGKEQNTLDSNTFPPRSLNKIFLNNSNIHQGNNLN